MTSTNKSKEILTELKEWLEPLSDLLQVPVDGDEQDALLTARFARLGLCVGMLAPSGAGSQLEHVWDAITTGFRCGATMRDSSNATSLQIDPTAIANESDDFQPQLMEIERETLVLTLALDGKSQKYTTHLPPGCRAGKVVDVARRVEEHLSKSTASPEENWSGAVVAATANLMASDQQGAGDLALLESFVAELFSCLQKTRSNLGGRIT